MSNHLYLLCFLVYENFGTNVAKKSRMFGGCDFQVKEAHEVGKYGCGGAIVRRTDSEECCWRSLRIRETGGYAPTRDVWIDT